MTLESAEAVLDRMEAEPAFAERVKDAGSPESGLALLTSEGFEVTPAEMRDAVLDRYGDQLTPDQLDQIAAGADLDGGWMIVGGMAGATVILCAAAMIV